MEETRTRRQEGPLGLESELPRGLFGRPIVLLDSGQSVDEAVFLEHFRRWVLERLQRTVPRREDGTPKWKHRVYLLHPSRYFWARYGSCPWSDYDEWEVRPVRWTRPLLASGFLSTYASFEEGCHFYGIKAPWRDVSDKYQRRAGVIYLNPTHRDLRWGAQHREKWKNDLNTPQFYLGHPSTGTVPRSAIGIADGYYAYTRPYYDAVKADFGGRGYGLNYMDLLGPSREPSHKVVAAPNWRHQQRARYPSMVEGWCEDIGVDCHAPEDDGRWETMLDATDTEFYFVASTRETVPFDAMLAAARGAKVVGPSLPLWKELFDHKWLYPVALGAHNEAVWSQTEVREWFRARLRLSHCPPE